MKEEEVYMTEGLTSSNIVPWYMRMIDIRYMLDKNLTTDAQALITYAISRPEVPGEDWIMRKKAMENYLGPYRCKNALKNLRTCGYACLRKQVDPRTGRLNASTWFIIPMPIAQEVSVQEGFEVLNPIKKGKTPAYDEVIETLQNHEWVLQSLTPLENQQGLNIVNGTRKTSGVKDLKLHSKITGYNNTTLVHRVLSNNTSISQTESDPLRGNGEAIETTEKKQKAVEKKGKEEEGKSSGVKSKKKSPKKGSGRGSRFGHIPKGTQSAIYQTWKEVWAKRFGPPPKLTSDQHRTMGTHIPNKIINQLNQGMESNVTIILSVDIIVAYWKQMLESMTDKDFEYYTTPAAINKYFADITGKIQNRKKNQVQSDDSTTNVRNTQKGHRSTGKASIHDEIERAKNKLRDSLNQFSETG